MVRRMRLLLALAVIAIALLGVTVAAPTAASGEGTALRIVVWPEGIDGSSRVYSLRCPRATGSLPSPKTACAKLAKLGRSAFLPVPRDAVCTQIYGGRQVARVTGRLAGRSLWVTFRKRDGCESARWSRLAFLFPVSRAAGSP